MYSASRYSFPNYPIHGVNRRSDNRDEWVSPFGNLRVKGCSHLTAAYRSVPRPSSPVCAKASTNCPYLTLESPHHQHQHRTRLKAALVVPSVSSARVRDDHNLSQIIYMSEPALLVAARPRRRGSRSAQSRYLTASILRTHSQCQRGSVVLP